MSNAFLDAKSLYLHPFHACAYFNSKNHEFACENHHASSARNGQGAKVDTIILCIMRPVARKYQLWALTVVSASFFTNGSALAAPITFDFGSSPTSITPTSASWAQKDFTISIGQPSGSGSPVMQSNSNGVCVFSDYGANASTVSPWCGQTKPNLLSNTTWTFTSPTGGRFRPLSYTLKGITTFPGNSIVANLTSTWTSSSVFSDSRTVPTNQIGSTVSPISVNFGSNFLIYSGTSFFLTNINNVSAPLSFRIQSFNLEQVPGPLPALGLAAGFAYSRRIRKRLKNN